MVDNKEDKLLNYNIIAEKVKNNDLELSNKDKTQTFPKELLLHKLASSYQIVSTANPFSDDYKNQKEQDNKTNMSAFDKKDEILKMLVMSGVDLEKKIDLNFNVEKSKDNMIPPTSGLELMNNRIDLLKGSAPEFSEHLNNTKKKLIDTNQFVQDTGLTIKILSDQTIAELTKNDKMSSLTSDELKTAIRNQLEEQVKKYNDNIAAINQDITNQNNIINQDNIRAREYNQVIDNYNQAATISNNHAKQYNDQSDNTNMMQMKNTMLNDTKMELTTLIALRRKISEDVMQSMTETTAKFMEEGIGVVKVTQLSKSEISTQQKKEDPNDKYNNFINQFNEKNIENNNKNIIKDNSKSSTSVRTSQKENQNIIENNQSIQNNNNKIKKSTDPAKKETNIKISEINKTIEETNKTVKTNNESDIVKMTEKIKEHNQNSNQVFNNNKIEVTTEKATESNKEKQKLQQTKKPTKIQGNPYKNTDIDKIRKISNNIPQEQIDNVNNSPLGLDSQTQKTEKHIKFSEELQDKDKAKQIGNDLKEALNNLNEKAKEKKNMNVKEDTSKIKKSNITRNR